MKTQAVDRPAVLLNTIMTQPQQKIAELVKQACLAEVSFDKPGNVSATESFCDASFDDFTKSAAAIAPVLQQVRAEGVGPTIREAVRRTQQAVGHNTNLGIILLLTPLAAVPADRPIAHGIASVLTSLTVTDAVAAYEGIQQSMAAGLGTTEQQDVAAVPTVDLRQCMQLAADRDLIARQYVNGFREVLTVSVPLLRQTCCWQQHQDRRLAWLAVQLLARFDDSLILRKQGADAAAEVRRRANEVLQSGWPHRKQSAEKYADFDAFLRNADHSLNPGTTADVIAATLFVLFRDHDAVFVQADRSLHIPDE